MNNTFGVAGGIPKTRHDLIQKKFEHIGVKVLLPKEDSDKVPNFIVKGSKANIPEKWSGAPEIPKDWLQYMMKVKLADLVWVDPKQWMEETKQEQREGGGDEGEEEEEEEEEKEKPEEARGRKRNTEALAAEIRAQKEAQAKAKAQQQEEEQQQQQPQQEEEQLQQLQQPQQEEEQQQQQQQQQQPQQEEEQQQQQQQPQQEEAQQQQQQQQQQQPQQEEEQQQQQQQQPQEVAQQQQQDKAQPGANANGNNKPAEVAPKQESTEPNLAAIPKPPGPDSDLSSTSSEGSASASSAASSGTAASASPKPLGPTEQKSPSPGSQSSKPSGTPSGRQMTPEQEAVEEEAIQAVKKARQAEAELKKAEGEAMKAVDRAKSAGVTSVDYTSDEHLKEDPRKFLIPAEYREEKTDAWGEIMYNTDTGFFLVYEKYGKFYRGYMFSGSEYPFAKQRFVDDAKGETLVCRKNVTKSGGRNAPSIFDLEIEAIAVSWRQNRVYRALVTLYDPEEPGKLLLYNITGLRTKYGASQVAHRLDDEFAKRVQTPIWPAPTKTTNRNENYERYLQKHGEDIMNGKKKLLGFKE